MDHPTGRKESEDLRRRANAAADLDGGESLWAEACAANPEDGTLWFGRAQHHQRHGSLEQAVRFFEHAMARKRDEASWRQAWKEARAELRRQKLKARASEVVSGITPGVTGPPEEALSSTPNLLVPSPSVAPAISGPASGPLGSLPPAAPLPLPPPMDLCSPDRAGNIPPGGSAGPAVNLPPVIAENQAVPATSGPGVEQQDPGRMTAILDERLHQLPGITPPAPAPTNMPAKPSGPATLDHDGETVVPKADDLDRVDPAGTMVFDGAMDELFQPGDDAPDGPGTSDRGEAAEDSRPMATETTPVPAPVQGDDLTSDTAGLDMMLDGASTVALSREDLAWIKGQDDGDGTQRQADCDASDHAETPKPAGERGAEAMLALLDNGEPGRVLEQLGDGGGHGLTPDERVVLEALAHMDCVALLLGRGPRVSGPLEQRLKELKRLLWG